MAKNLKRELMDLKIESEILNKTYCSPEQNKMFEELLNAGQPLPSGIYLCIKEDGEPSVKYFCEISDSGLTQGELMEYIALKQLKMVKTIKNCAVYFTALSIISAVVGFIMTLIIISK